MPLTDSGLGENITETSSPSEAPIFSMTSFGTNMHPFLTTLSDLLAIMTYCLLPHICTRSPSLTPISTQSRSCIIALGSMDSTSYALTISFISVPTFPMLCGVPHDPSHIPLRGCVRMPHPRPVTSPWRPSSRLRGVLRHLLLPVS